MHRVSRLLISIAEYIGKEWKTRSDVSIGGDSSLYQAFLELISICGLVKNADLS